MGAVPKKKVTRDRRGSKFTSYRLHHRSLSVCPQCRTAKLPHIVCPKCGFYRGRAVVQVAEEKEQGRQPA